MKLSDFSIRRPVFTTVAILLFLLLGVVSLVNIPLQLIPNIKPPIGAVAVTYEGADPTEVLEKVTKPIEDALSTLPGLKTMQSVSQEGSSLTILEFSWTTSFEDVQDEMTSAINQVNVPDGAGTPRFLKFDPSQFPIIQMAVASGKNQDELQSLSADLKQDLMNVEGVASVDIAGVRVDEIEVELDQEQLKTYRLSQQDVVELIQSHNISLPGSPISSEGERLTTRVVSTMTSVDDVKNLVITKDNAGDDVTLSDLAEVERQKEQLEVMTRANQDDAVLISVLQQSDANTAAVSQAFHDRLDMLLDEEKYREVDTAVLFDQGEYVQLAIGSVTSALISGGLLATLVLFLFLRSIKSPLIIGIAIPFSVIVTFVLLFFADFSLNIMTLGGLALGIGMLVDNSIVVIESIYRHLQMGKAPKEAASVGTKEVASAITASTLTTVAVFLPVLFISGFIGNLFRELALTVAFSLFASLFVALTVVPMLASRLLKEQKENVEQKSRQSLLIQSVERPVRWVLSRRFAVIVVTLVLLLLSGLGLTTVGTQFLPATDEGFFTVRITHENGTDLKTTEETVSRVEKVLAEDNEIENYLSLIGSTAGQGPVGSGAANEAEIFVATVDLDERRRSTMEISEDLQKDIVRAAGEADVAISQHGSMANEPNTLTFTVRADNENDLTEAVHLIQDELASLDHMNDVTNDREDTVEEIQIVVNRDQALTAGFVPLQVANVVNNVTRGQQATQVTTAEGDVLDVYVRYDEAVTENIDALEELLLKKPDGTYTTLGDVTTIERGEGPAAINRDNQRPAVQFTAKFSSDATLGSIAREVMQAISDLDLPDGVETAFTGDQELLQQSFRDLGFAFVLAVVFVFLVMAAQFESFRYPFVILFTIPFIVIGVMLALTLTRTPIGVTAIIGLIILAGIVVNNAIVLVDYINQKKAQGWRSYDAIIEAVKVRTRPILMTATTTVLGLVPLALGIGEGAEIQQPLAITVIGGLVSSTFLTLFVIPVVYSLFDKETRRLNKKYVTPDGELIPAYLLDTVQRKKAERKADKERESETLPASEGDKEDLSKDELISLLEKLVEVSKKDKKTDD